MIEQSLLKELELGPKSKVKRRIIAELITRDKATINDLAKVVSLSIPSVTKIVSDMMHSGWIVSAGKLEVSGGRYPYLYKLREEAAYFVGVDVKHDHINIGIIDIVGQMRYSAFEVPYILNNTQESLDKLCQLVLEHVKASKHRIREVLNINFNIPGRINPQTGESHNHFTFIEGKTLSDVLAEKIGTHVSLDNDTRGMTYGEFTQGVCVQDGQEPPRNALYVNFSWGLGLGVIVDHKIHLGKSGFSGEIGHITAFDNQIICHCGKKGCFETEVSGLALQRKVKERILAGESSMLSSLVQKGKEISLEQIIVAARSEDALVLELISEQIISLGEQISTLMNILNPDMVIIGGSISRIGDYLLDVLKPVVRKYSLNIVSKDTQIVLAKLGDRAGLIGACMQARIRRFSQNSISSDY